ncbi:MAG: O-methyltransferase [Hyphomicrobiales bacterium]|nr:O-methyltransferase [Hyphomicrobiales bacterium]MBV9908903.1 O-methyltransferase [Hyphomicrobiales bacterium]
MTNRSNWSEVDSYFAGTLIGSDPALEATLKANAAGGLPSIDVSAPQGKLIHLLARMSGARKALEIGTLGGYSTIWLARALPEDGRLITLEVSARHADVARRNVAHAGLESKVEIRTGAALTTLPKLEAEGLGPFDFVFIDADKTNNAAYLEWALRLSRRGTTIVVDNVVREGGVADAASRDPGVVGVRRMFELMEREPRLSATAIQTVGAKGWDGFALAVVN